MITRRDFVAAGLGGAAMLETASGVPARTGLYVLENYYLKNGSQVERIHRWFSQGLLPELGRIHAGPKLVLEALVAPHMPQVAAITGYASVEEWLAVRKKKAASEAIGHALEAWEDGPEPPYEHYSETLLQATDYSPEIAASKPGSPPRIFELRVYHSSTLRQLKALHERFAGPEVKIFARCGIHPLLYTSGLAGQNLPNLTYLTPFESLAAREKAWAAFGADPEWIKVRKESIDKYGQISSVIQIALYKSAAYSPVQ